MPSTHLPFPALVGLELAQQALILLAIEPRLGGIILAACAGTGKTSLARGIHDILGRDNVPFVEIPASIDADNLLGGVNLEATLRAGEMVMQEGVLARADGGIAYVDGINLLTDQISNLLLSVLDEGVVNYEREGVSVKWEARFNLIGSYDPAEGLPRQHLIDRIGLIVPLTAKHDAQQRATVLRRNLRRDESLQSQWDEEITFLHGIIKAAREHLPQVEIDEEQVKQLSSLAVAYGVEGHRADTFAVYAACASAAAEFRDTVSNDDIEMAVRLVILPRATRIPAPPPEDARPPQEAEQQNTDQQPENENPPPQDQHEEPEDDQEPPEESAMPDELLAPEDEIMEALNSELPEDLEELPFTHVRRGQSGSRGATEAQRGRHIRSIQGDPRQGRIDVVSTLRVAAPWQNFRASLQDNDSEDERRVLLETSDIRVKKYRSKAGALFCFAVDASGSMALHRMRQAKGAVHNLLEKAYVKRDKVALIAFRGEGAELLMPPTQSVELARKALDLLPTGGGTPLASALLMGIDVAEQAKMRGIMQTVLVLLTDGRGNIPHAPDADPQAELQQLGRHIAESPLRVVVVDTKRDYLSRGEARQLAEWLNADYAYLPNASGEQIGSFVSDLR
ncbi:MAG: magnesium chelatase ATPase subunit D [Chloroflexota bacterium]